MTIVTDLPEELLGLVSKRLTKLEDFVSFKSASKSLDRAARCEDFHGIPIRKGLPYLLLPVKDDSDDVRELYSLIPGESTVASVEVPNFQGKKCYESLGWLLCVERDGSMGLINPFSSTVIELPHQNTILDREFFMLDELVYFHKALLSADPTITDTYILMCICARNHILTFWMSEDKTWNVVPIQDIAPYCDVVYNETAATFCAVDKWGLVTVFRIVRDHYTSAYNTTVESSVDCGAALPYFDLPDWNSSVNMYLMVSFDGTLFMLLRYYRMPRDRSTYKTTRFEVVKVDVVNKSFKQMDNMGGVAAFVGHNSSICVDTSRFKMLKADHVYFTDDNWFYYYEWSESHEGGGRDSGVYNLQTDEIEPLHPAQPLCSRISTSLWISPQ